MDILGLINDVAFPILMTIFLLYFGNKRLEKYNNTLIKLEVFIIILLSKNGINISDPQLAAAVKSYVDRQKQTITDKV